MTRPAQVTADDLRAAKWVFALHINMGGRGGYVSYRCAEFPELTLFRGQERVNGRMKPFNVISVTNENGDKTEFSVRHLDLAAEAITKIRQASADDAAWDAAAPKKDTAA